MARPLSDLDPSTGPLAAFAHDLRTVRREAGEPTLETMSQRANVSRSALSDAMSGKKLPTAAVLASFLRACDCPQKDIDSWQERRGALAKLSERELLAAPMRPADTPGDASGTERARSSMPGLALVTVLVVVSLALGCGVGFAVGRATAPDAVAAPSSSPTPPHTGDNPVAAGCTGDGKAVVAEEQPDGTLVEMMWSDTCLANWGRITRYDGLAKGNSVTVKITGHFTNAPNPQIVTANDQQSAYTPIMIVGPADKVCVSGSYTVGDTTIDVAKPACG